LNREENLHLAHEAVFLVEYKSHYGVSRIKLNIDEYNAVFKSALRVHFFVLEGRHV
jgi:hypothetical protein